MHTTPDYDSLHIAMDAMLPYRHTLYRDTHKLRQACALPLKHQARKPGPSGLGSARVSYMPGVTVQNRAKSFPW